MSFTDHRTNRFDDSFVDVVGFIVFYFISILMTTYVGIFLGITLKPNKFMLAGYGSATFVMIAIPMWAQSSTLSFASNTSDKELVDMCTLMDNFGWKKGERDIQVV